jgi:parallel beta-helix repeat protein
MIRTGRIRPRRLLPFPALALAALLPAAGPLSARVLSVPFEYPTIQSGIDAATGGDTVVVMPGVYYEHGIDFNGKAILVTGADPYDTLIVATTVVDARDEGSVFTFRSGEGPGSILAGLTIRDGHATYGGGIACVNGSSPAISHNIIESNLADEGGGGIRCRQSAPGIFENIIRDNRAAFGSGIDCYLSAPAIQNNVITENGWDQDPQSEGGGIYLGASSPLISDNTISYNEARWNGGGILCRNGSGAVIRDNLITGNYSWDHHGGGIYCDGSSPTIEGNTITENRGAWGGIGWGAGISLENGSAAIIRGNTISRNVNGANGGGISCYQSDATITGNEIDHNDARDGAGILLLGSDALITSNTIRWNTGTYGGGIAAYSGSSPTIRYNIVSNNRARGAAGIRIWADGSGIIENNRIENNTADTYKGGGIACAFHSADVWVANNVIVGNSAISGGGGILCDTSDMTVVNTICRGNSAADGPQIYLDSVLDPATLTIRYSDVQGGEADVFLDDNTTLDWGDGMIDALPLFMTYLGYQKLLDPDSPCIDTGDPAIEDGLSDWHPRWPPGYPDGPRSDMGAYGGPGNSGWLP